MNKTSANRLRAFAVCAVFFLLGMLSDGKIQAMDFFNWMSEQDTVAQLTRQRNDLAHRMDKEIPDAKARLDENLRLALSQLDEAKKEDSIAWVMDELRSNIRIQLKLPVYREQCREALIRLDSMLRRIQQEGSLPEEILPGYERSAGTANRLMDGGVLENMIGIEVDDLKVEAMLQEVLAERRQYRTREPVLPPAQEHRGFFQQFWNRLEADAGASSSF